MKKLARPCGTRDLDRLLIIKIFAICDRKSMMYVRSKNFKLIS